MTIGTVLVFMAGLAALVAGAELLVRGASAISARTGLSPVVIGLTVVAFGTSTPELAVSVSATTGGDGAIAVGNVIGSNIANVLVILGVSAIVGGGLVVAQRLVRLDIPLMIGASILVWVLAANGVLGQVEGLILVGLLVVYTAATVIGARRESPEIEAEYAEAVPVDRLSQRPVLVDLGQVLVGLVGLVVGGRWLVSAASTAAEAFGVSDLVIGLTVVAIGTSMPELATSIVAALRGERDIAVGNVVGSNLFNLLGVLGVSALVAPDGLEVLASARNFDLPVMTVVAVACLPFLFTGHLLARWEGAAFVGFYALYVSHLVLDATGAALLDPFRAAVTLFVLPLTVLTLVVVWGRERRAARLGVG